LVVFLTPLSQGMFSWYVARLRAGGEEVLLEHHAELFPDALQLLEVLVVLALVLDLGVDACAVLVCAFEVLRCRKT
jgi:hypothetical protein